MSENELQKPITVRREEFSNVIMEACNNSGLPFFVVEDVLNHIIPIVSNAAKEQYKMDKSRYEESIKKEAGDTKEQV